MPHTTTTRTPLTPQNLIGDLVERMTNPPPNCMFCGCGNVPDESGEIGPFLATRLDRAWGDSCYICPPCGMSVGAIFGMAGPDELAAAQRATRLRDREIHDLKSQIERTERQRDSNKTKLDAALITKKELARRKKRSEKAAA